MSTRDAMQQEIYENGPVIVSLNAYEDFYSYGGGVYSHTEGGMVGGHAMRLIGWGHDENDHLYWIAHNQWSKDWGEAGYARIKAGQIEID